MAKRAPKFPNIEPQRTCACGSGMAVTDQRTFRRNDDWFSERVSTCLRCGWVVKKRLKRGPTGITEKLEDVTRRLKEQIKAIESRGRVGSAASG
jgi:hypothetical protein